MPGKGDIQNTKNAGIAGFAQNPQNISKKGRPPSVRNQLKELLKSEGQYIIPKEQILELKENGSIVVKMTTEMQLAIKLQQIAMAGKNANTLKAIQMIIEQIDGKPMQEITVVQEQRLFTDEK